jgi:hypothetical protein
MAVKKTPAKSSVKKATSTLSFDNALLVKHLLQEVPERAREVLTLRFGLGTASSRETLEAIGERWGITRERVRQIEAAGIETIRNSKVFKEEIGAFDELASHIESLGGIIPEDALLSGLATDEKSRNRFRFLLVICPFLRAFATASSVSKTCMEIESRSGVPSANFSLRSNT